jgi:hypothetical protein
MMRQAARGALALVLVTAVLDSTGFGQPGVGVKVYYRDKKDREGPEKIIDGEQLKVTPAGVQVINKGAVSATLSPNDIIRVDPGEVPPLDRKDVAAQITLERERKWEPALATYLDMQKKAKAANAPAPTNRYLEFKVAYTSARAADDAADDAWKDKTEAAQKLLNDYLIATNFTGGWEVWPAGRMRARMVFELDRPADAVATWGKLAKSPDVPADLQREAAFEEIDFNIRAKQLPVATQLITALKPGATGAAKDRLTAYETAIKCAEAAVPNGPTPIAQVVKPLQDLIDKSADPVVKAVGHNLIGEVCMLAEKPREAMWNYLWVEVVYNQDRDEVLKAMVRLVKSFDAQGDEDRAKTYREKLRRYRGVV